jgi:hypothetical protein
VESSEEEPVLQHTDFVAVPYLKYRLQVPANKQQAAVFYVHTSVSLWALLVLRSEGWQLIRDDPHYSHRPRFPFHEEGEPLRQGIPSEPIRQLRPSRPAGGPKAKKEEIYESES